jgi:hypothetical protein
MKRKNIIRVVFTLLILIQSSFAFAQEKMDESKIREEQAYTLGTSAYTWGFTMTEIYRVRDMQIKAFGAVNTFFHIRGTRRPGDHESWWSCVSKQCDGVFASMARSLARTNRA